jgi:hypothetical protein
MATWKSIKEIKYEEDMGMAYADVSLKWEYRTTSDILTIFENTAAYADFEPRPAKLSVRHHSLEGARNQFKLLANFIRQFEGEEKLEKLLKESENE